MMDSAIILPSWIQTISSLRFTQKHSGFSILTLTQTNSIWLKLIHSHSTWWWQPSWILPSWFGHLGFSHLSYFSQTHSHLPRLVPTICTKKKLHSFILTQLDDGSHLEFCHVGFIILPSFILTQLDDGSHLEFCHLEFGHLGFSHLNIFSQTHSHLPRLVPTICTKKNFTHSFWLNLMMAAILNSAMLDSDTAILDSDTLLSSLRFTQKHSHSTLTLTQTNSIWLKLIHSHFNLMMAAILNSAILDSAILHKTLTQTNSIWLKLIHSDSTWWWQPSWILPSWILPSWIQTPCYLLSDSLKNTLTPLWLWLKLIQSDSNSFILT